jgi:hypothetical protein
MINFYTHIFTYENISLGKILKYVHLVEFGSHIVPKLSCRKHMFPFLYLLYLWHLLPASDTTPWNQYW